MNAKRAFSALITVAVLTVLVFGIVGLTPVLVSAQNSLTLSGPTTGRVNEPLTYSVHVVGTETLRSAADIAVQFTFIRGTSIVGTVSGISNTQGLASATFTFTQAGSSRVVAVAAGASSKSIDVTITPQAAPSGIAVVSPTPTATTPTPTDGGGQPTGGDSGQTPAVGDATATKTTNTSTAGLADIASQAEAATGLGSDTLLIVFGIAIVILLAVIAAVLLMRRKG